jgi:hypothetical protein
MDRQMMGRKQPCEDPGAKCSGKVINLGIEETQKGHFAGEEWTMRE